MKHILFLTQILPYPPNAGPRVKTWQVLRYLAAAGHHITLVSFVRPEEEPYLPVVKELVDELWAIPFQRSLQKELAAAIRSILKGCPFLVERDADPEMRRIIGRIMDRATIDAIHADQVTMTQYVAPEKGHFTVFDAHNATWQILEGSKQLQPLWLRPIITRETSAMKRYEGEIVSSFDATLAVTEADKADLLEAVEDCGQELSPREEHIKVVPITIDTEELRPTEATSAGLEILSIGSLHYAPNADGVRWFLQEVFPSVANHIQEVRVSVIGKNPPPDFKNIAIQSGGKIQLEGYVEDLDPYFKRASLMVVPVLSGSGMRVRILEGLARGIPMVTTTLGVQGINARHGEEIMIADSEAKFSEMVMKLLQEPALCRKLSRQGRKLAVEQYDWRLALKPMGEIYR